MRICCFGPRVPTSGVAAPESADANQETHRRAIGRVRREIDQWALPVARSQPLTAFSGMVLRVAISWLVSRSRNV